MGLIFSKRDQEEINEDQIDLTKNKNWLAFIEEYFDCIDVNKNGYVVIEDTLKWCDSIEENFKVTPEQAKNMRENFKEFFGAVGLVPDEQMTKAEFVEGVNQLAPAELKRKRLGEETLHHKVSNAFSDIMDINNDGTIGLDELTKLMKACKMTESKSVEMFNKADQNENGTLDRKKFADVEFNLWFNPAEES